MNMNVPYHTYSTKEAVKKLITPTHRNKHNKQSNIMSSSTKNNSSNKSEALARARTWRDQRCVPSPSANKTKKIAVVDHDQPGFTARRSTRAPSPAKVTTAASTSPKKEAKDRALARARDFAIRLKEKKEQPMDMDVDEKCIFNVIDVDENSSFGAATFSTARDDAFSSAEMEEMNRIAVDLKKLSERLEAVTTKNVRNI